MIIIPKHLVTFNTIRMYAGGPLKIIQLISCGTVLFKLEASLIQNMPHTPTFLLAAVGKGRSSPLNHMVHFGSFRPGKMFYSSAISP